MNGTLLLNHPWLVSWVPIVLYALAGILIAAIIYFVNIGKHQGWLQRRINDLDGKLNEESQKAPAEQNKGTVANLEERKKLYEKRLRSVGPRYLVLAAFLIAVGFMWQISVDDGGTSKKIAEMKKTVSKKETLTESIEASLPQDDGFKKLFAELNKDNCKKIADQGQKIEKVSKNVEELSKKIDENDEETKRQIDTVSRDVKTTENVMIALDQKLTELLHSTSTDHGARLEQPISANPDAAMEKFLVQQQKQMQTLFDWQSNNTVLLQAGMKEQQENQKSAENRFAALEEWMIVGKRMQKQTDGQASQGLIDGSRITDVEHAVTFTVDMVTPGYGVINPIIPGPYRREYQMRMTLKYYGTVTRDQAMAVARGAAELFNKKRGNHYAKNSDSQMHLDLDDQRLFYDYIAKNNIKDVAIDHVTIVPLAKLARNGQVSKLVQDRVPVYDQTYTSNSQHGPVPMNASAVPVMDSTSTTAVAGK